MIQRGVCAARLEQALVRALLDDLAVVDDQNHVGLTVVESLCAMTNEVVPCISVCVAF